MFRKVTQQQLLLVLAVLVALYGLSWAFDARGKASFEKTLTQIDTARVDRLEILRPEEAPLSLTKGAAGWQVSQGDVPYQASASLVESALNDIAALEARQLVARQADRWQDYEVDDSTGIRVKVFEGENVLADLMVGRFQYQQTGMMNFIRPSEGEETYLVDGFLRTTFDKAPESWRDKTLLKGPNSQWNTLTFTYPNDTTFRLNRGAGNRWYLPDSTELDPAAVSRYLNRITTLNGQTFVEAPAMQVSHSLQIAAANGNILLRGYAVNDSTRVIHSSLNPDAYFDGDALWERVFVSLSSLMPASE